MSVMRSEQWTDAHLSANEALAKLLNQLRDCGYNPSLHITYNRETSHVTIESSVLDQHPELQPTYEAYLDACARRSKALDNIQALPKEDLNL